MFWYCSWQLVRLKLQLQLQLQLHRSLILIEMHCQPHTHMHTHTCTLGGTTHKCDPRGNKSSTRTRSHSECSIRFWTCVIRFAVATKYACQVLNALICVPMLMLCELVCVTNNWPGSRRQMLMSMSVWSLPSCCLHKS